MMQSSTHPLYREGLHSSPDAAAAAAAAFLAYFLSSFSPDRNLSFSSAQFPTHSTLEDFCDPVLWCEFSDCFLCSIQIISLTPVLIGRGASSSPCQNGSRILHFFPCI